jgi:hypothetical protein
MSAHTATFLVKTAHRVVTDRCWRSRSTVRSRVAILQSHDMSVEQPHSADYIETRVRTLAEGLERARFAGASPRVEVPANASADEVIARTLAAERLGLPLVLGENAYHLHERRAWEGLWAAQDALGRWGFGEAESRLDRASALAVDPALQQRLGLWKLLTALVRRLVRAHPEDDLRGDPARPAVELLDAADRLPEAEREHYQNEVRRLVSAHTTAGEQPDSVERALWYVIRARLTLAADEPLAALAWCVRLGKLQAARLPDDPYLTGLLQKSRTYALLQLGELDEETTAAARAETRDLQAWDVYRALVAHLGPALGVDLQREVARFTIAPYRDADD